MTRKKSYHIWSLYDYFIICPQTPHIFGDNCINIIPPPLPRAHQLWSPTPLHVAGTRFGESRMDGFNMVALLLPGVAVTYYGEEIGMINTNIAFEDTVGEWGWQNKQTY